MTPSLLATLNISGVAACILNLRIDHAELRTKSAEFRINYVEFRKKHAEFLQFLQFLYGIPHEHAELCKGFTICRISSASLIGNFSAPGAEKSDLMSF